MFFGIQNTPQGSSRSTIRKAKKSKAFALASKQRKNIWTEVLRSLGFLFIEADVGFGFDVVSLDKKAAKKEID